MLNKEGQPETVKYQVLAPLMLNELQKERALLDAQTKTVDAQAKIIAEQKEQLDAVTARLAFLERLIKKFSPNVETAPTQP